MKKFVIEREMPKIGSADRDAFKAAAQKSNGVLKELGPSIQWVESHVTADKIFCRLPRRERGANSKTRRDQRLPGR